MESLKELIAFGASGFGLLKDEDGKQFARGFNEEAPPGVLQQLASFNVAVCCETAGIWFFSQKNSPESSFRPQYLCKKKLGRCHL